MTSVQSLLFDALGISGVVPQELCCHSVECVGCPSVCVCVCVFSADVIPVAHPSLSTSCLPLAPKSHANAPHRSLLTVSSHASCLFVKYRLICSLPEATV